MRSLQRQLAQRDAVIADLVRRVEALERRSATASAAAPAQAPPPAAAPTAGRPAGTAAASPAEEPARREDVTRALERTLVQKGGLLLPAWSAEVEPEAAYTHQSSGGLGIVTLAGVPNVVQRNERRDTVESALSFRLGLPWEMQADLRVPHVYERERTSVAGTGARRARTGLGDVQIGVSKQLLTERGALPSVLAGVSWKTATGEGRGLADPATGSAGPALGTGGHAVQGSLTAVKTQDPLVFFGSLSYTANFEGKVSGQRFEAGDAVRLKAGTILAATPETSLTFALDTAFIGKSRLDGRSLAGTDAVSGTLELGVGTVLTPTTLLSITTGIGFTDAAPDFRIGVSLPMRF